MNAAIGYGQTAWEPERIEAPECPSWLSDDLRANPVFVREAIENSDDCAAKFAAAYIAGSGAYCYLAADDAVDAWIAHVWQRHDYDAGLIFRMWRELSEEAKAA